MSNSLVSLLVLAPLRYASLRWKPPYGAKGAWGPAAELPIDWCDTDLSRSLGSQAQKDFDRIRVTCVWFWCAKSSDIASKAPASRAIARFPRSKAMAGRFAPYFDAISLYFLNILWTYILNYIFWIPFKNVRYVPASGVEIYNLNPLLKTQAPTHVKFASYASSLNC